MTEVWGQPNYVPTQASYQPMGQQPTYQPQVSRPQSNTGQSQINGGQAAHTQPVMGNPDRPQSRPLQHQQQSQQEQEQIPRKPVPKLPTADGKPMPRVNFVEMNGYINKLSYKEFNQYTARLGFELVEEVPLCKYGNPEIPILDESGHQIISDVAHRGQAWNDVAYALAQYPEGTPVRIQAELIKWSSKDNNTGKRNYFVDLKVISFLPL
jgi:hypothetical protein